MRGKGIAIGLGVGLDAFHIVVLFELGYIDQRTFTVEPPRVVRAEQCTVVFDASFRQWDLAMGTRIDKGPPLTTYSFGTLGPLLFRTKEPSFNGCIVSNNDIHSKNLEFVRHFGI